MRLSRLVPLYVALLLVLAGFGALNQDRYEHQLSLLDRKARLYDRIVELRAESALVRGPLAVGAWARREGMVPAPEIASVRHVARYEAPAATEQPSGLEVRTVWR